MSRKYVKYLLAFLVVAVLIVPVFADTVTKMITISTTTKISGTDLKQGETYAFKVDENKLTVEKDHKVVAEATGRWEECEDKWKFNSFVHDENGQVIEVRFGGEKRCFKIGSN